MKAVIVVNLPENTQIEDFRLDDISVYHRPNQRGYKLQGELKPMPEEKHRDTRFDDIAGAIDYGWNSCLAALEGKDMIDKLNKHADKILGE